MANSFVLDSSALLAVINEEAGAEIVEKILGRSVISTVNLAETVGKLASENVSADDAQTAICDMVQDVIPFDRNMALIAGRLTPHTRSLGLSLGDRACLATALYLNLEAVTADKIWSKLKEPIKIKVIR